MHGELHIMSELLATYQGLSETGKAWFKEQLLQERVAKPKRIMSETQKEAMRQGRLRKRMAMAQLAETNGS